jgi:EmrB/QacA subfamily drug resistance transporter
MTSSRPLVILIPALAIVFLSSVDLTVIAPILPLVLFDLNINTAEADRYVWIVTGYLIAYTVSIPVMGRLSDVIGRYRTLAIAVALFVAGSFVCAVSNDLLQLVIGRVIQGAGGGAMLPVTLALVADLYPSRGRAPVIGIVAAVETLGWVLGPIWGSLIEQAAGSWRWVFWINIPFGLAVGAVLVYRWNALVRPSEARVRFDPAGALLAVLALGALTLGLSVAESPTGTADVRAFGAQPHPLDGYRLWIVLFGVVALAGFVAAQRRVRSPLLPLELFGSARFSLATLANFLLGVALMIALVNVPVKVALLVSAARLSVVTAQLLAAFSLAMAVAAVAGGRMSNRLGPRVPAATGFAIATVGYFWMSQWSHEIAYGSMIPSLALAGAGLGLVIAPLATSVINLAERRDLGITSGLVIIARLLGMTLSISVLTAWATQRINREIQALPFPQQRANETLAEYLARQEEFVFERAIPITLDTLQSTFAVAAIVCLLAISVTLLISRSGPAQSQRQE